jgi:hypothetical protein
LPLDTAMPTPFQLVIFVLVFAMAGMIPLVWPGDDDKTALAASAIYV